MNDSATGRFADLVGPLPLAFSFSPVDQAVWRRSHQSGLETRDMGGHMASEGFLDTQLLRAADGQAGRRTGWVSSDLDFHYMHVLKGTLELRTLDGEIVTLAKGDIAVQPPFAFDPGHFVFSGDFEALQITANGAFALIEAKIPELRAQPIAHERKYIVTRESPEAHIVGDGPRQYFSYRDTGARESTAGRIHIHIVGIVATPPDGSTGWHDHTMDQFFTVLTGTSRDNIDTAPFLSLKPGDGVTIPAGLAHDFGWYTDDYSVVEVCIPAEYDTRPREKPADK